MMLKMTTRTRMTVSAVLCGLALAVGAGYAVTAAQPPVRSTSSWPAAG